VGKGEGGFENICHASLRVTIAESGGIDAWGLASFIGLSGITSGIGVVPGGVIKRSENMSSKI